MILTISTTGGPNTAATDLGWVLHKHPDNHRSVELSYGIAHVFFPEAGDDKTTVALLVQVDPVRLVRSGQKHVAAPLQQYVNDRPFATSSIMTVAISRVFGTALAGNCKQRPELPTEAFDLEVTLSVVGSRSGAPFFRRLFEPLGYEVEASLHPAPENDGIEITSFHHKLTLRGSLTIQTLLQHLCVLIPVLDGQKHYFVSDDEVEKLVRRGGEWLANHPEKELISQRYLRRQRSLVRSALDRLKELEDEPPVIDEEENTDSDSPSESKKSLNEIRHQTVVEKLKSSGAKSVADVGCAEGKLTQRLEKVSQFEKIVAADVSTVSLRRAERRLKLDRQPSERVSLIHSSLCYHDPRLDEVDAIAVVEVIEHFDPWRLAAFERVIFGANRPQTVVLTTPNVEYNAVYEMSEDATRHDDHRFEWTRDEFGAWCAEIGERFGYTFEPFEIGEVDPVHGPSTQGVVFTKSIAQQQPAGETE